MGVGAAVLLLLFIGFHNARDAVIPPVAQERPSVSRLRSAARRGYGRVAIAARIS
jgi:hypothetical protein